MQLPTITSNVQVPVGWYTHCTHTLGVSEELELELDLLDDDEDELFELDEEELERLEMDDELELEELLELDEELELLELELEELDLLDDEDEELLELDDDELDLELELLDALLYGTSFVALLNALTSPETTLSVPADV